MELGGKAPAIVLQDADLDKAARGCILGAFIHSGQVCMSTERILVHESIVEDFTAALKITMDDMYGKDSPAPILVAPPGIKKNKELVQEALSQGAKIVCGDVNAKEHSETRMR
jgi:acyl-CoA reductase-like NAD-dependent aldehyde dehydrogenase